MDKMNLPKILPIDEDAREKGDQLLRKVCSKIGVWKKDGWEAIFREIAEEGVCMRMAGPYAVVRYEVYVRIACAYLVNHRDHSKAKELIERVEDDVSKLTSVLRKMETKHFTFEEIKAIKQAEVGISVSVDTIKKNHLDLL